MSVSRIEELIRTEERLSYDIITDDALQLAGSMLLASYDDPAYTAYDKSRAINNLIAAIRIKVEGHNNIVSANYLLPEGIQYTISNTRYLRPEERIFKVIEQYALDKEGSSVIMSFTDEAVYANYLIIARQIRERANQTLRNIGVVYLLIDMRQITELYRRSNGYGLIIEDSAGHILFSFMDELKTNLSIEELTAIDWDRRFPRSSGEFFAVAVLDSEHTQYRYRVISPITAVYNQYSRSILFVILLYSIVVLGMLFAAMLSTRSVTGQLMKLVKYIQTIPKNNGRIDSIDITMLKTHPITGIDISEVIALKNAYDEMLIRINTLMNHAYNQLIIIKNAEISALQAQFNPHFLYNTLNSVYWAANTAGYEDIIPIIRSLSILMREAIDGKNHVVPLEKELEILSHYINIQKQRYADRFELELNVETDYLNSAVPKFTLQPLLENAFTHGVENMLEPCRILVSVYDEDEVLVCEVCNTGSIIDEEILLKLSQNTVKPKGNGVGLANIDFRIKSLFGSQYGITLKNDLQKGVIVRAELKRTIISEYLKQNPEL